MRNLMIAVTGYATEKARRRERLLVRAGGEQLRLKYMAARTNIGNGRHARRSCRMVAVTGGAGGRAEVPALNQCAMMNALAVAGKLVRRNLVAAHVIRVRVASRAGIRNVRRINFGLWIRRRTQVVHAMAVHAYCHFGVTGSQPRPVDAGFVLAELVRAQSGI